MANLRVLDPTEAPVGYRAVQTTGLCNGCAFYAAPVVTSGCGQVPCTPHKRKDHCRVIFVPITNPTTVE